MSQALKPVPCFTPPLVRKWEALGTFLVSGQAMSRHPGGWAEEECKPTDIQQGPRWVRVLGT